MEQSSEYTLQQSADLARQAAAQMKKAAKLAEQAAQLWQKALTLAHQEGFSQPPAPVQMAVAAPKRKTPPRVRPETTQRLEYATLRQATALSETTDSVSVSQPEPVWEDGDDWWKPLPQTSLSNA